MGRRKIRNLRQSANPPNNQSKCGRFKCFVLFFAVITSVIGILTYYIDNVNIIHRRLREQVDRQYNYHLYGKMDYCNQQFQPNTLSEPLKLHVINQSDALDQIISAIENLTNVVSLALVGGSGVGKTLTCNIIQSHFQWSSNVFYFIWSPTRSTASQYYKILKSIKQISTNCGAHLVIIDNLGVTDVKTIQDLNVEIQKEFSQSGHLVLVVYVFNLASYSDEDLETLEEKRKRLQDLRGITTVNFRSFNRYDVERCIVLESIKLNVSLSDKEINEMLEYIDWSRSGCKLIHSKVAIYT